MSRFESLAAIGILVLVIGGTIGIVALAGIETIDYDEYGLSYNWVQKTVNEDKIYDAGLHWIGPGHNFIKFPKLYETIEFSPSKDADDIAINTQTVDGLKVIIDASFQYRVVSNDLVELYSMFGGEYRRAILIQARDSIRDTASKYTAIEFFYNRTGVGDMMENDLKTQMSLIHIDVGFFQLRSIDLPNSFEQATEAVEVARQEIQKAEYEKEAARIRAETLVIEADAYANITITEIQALAQGVNITLTAEAESYRILMDTLNLNSTELLSYLWINAIMEHDEAWLVIGENAPVILVPSVTNSTST